MNQLSVESAHHSGINVSFAVIQCWVFLFILAWLWLWLLHLWKKPTPKMAGPRAWPILGSSMELQKNVDHFYDWMLIYFAQAKSFTVHLPHLSMTYTVDPLVLEHVLKTNFANYPKGDSFYEKLEVIFGDGIFNSDGEAWRRQRKIASFEFSSKVLREFSTCVFRDYSLKLARIVAHAARTAEPLEMQDLFMRLTLDSICKVGFGVELQLLSPSLPQNSFAAAFDHVNIVVAMRFTDPLWKAKRFLSIGQEGLLKQSAKIMNDFTYKIISKRREELKAKDGNLKAMKSDLLSRYMELGDDPETHITDKTLRDVVLNFIIAGRDTTGATLSWFIYMMAMHPEIAEKVYEELKQLGPASSDPKPSTSSCGLDGEEGSFNQLLEDFANHLDYDALAKLPYLHAALTEVLRLYPAVPLLIKGIAADDIAPDGTHFRKGALIGYVPYCMGRMEFIWGPDAYQYKPERWLKNGVFQAESPFKFSAFQAGPRLCLGKDSAYLQMKMVAGLLCRYFKFTLVPGHTVKYRVMAILSMAHGLKVTISKRSI